MTYLGKCTIFLAEELVCFGESLVSLFCLTTFAEYAKSSLRDQIYKVMYQLFVFSLWILYYMLTLFFIYFQLARRICSILFSLQQEHHTSMLVTNILACVLKSLTLEIEWKVQLIEKLCLKFFPIPTLPSISFIECTIS